jgi:hypothetical protein
MDDNLLKQRDYWNKFDEERMNTFNLQKYLEGLGKAIIDVIKERQLQRHIGFAPTISHQSI